MGNAIGAIFGGAVLVGVGAIIVLAVQNEIAFSKYASEHHCYVVERVKQDDLLIPVFDSMTNMVTIQIQSQPDKLRYLCDGNETFWR